ncbi:MAG TPA: DNA-directed RNA polymerase subunit alpha C-terminal domain-containing protein [Chitinophagales bacterium]|nr:DNA-directed RNA polymerase subunit alpha C-terminal domain-containing protein [Chitinophagales bacterium]
MKTLAAPARRALESKHITTLEKLASFTEAELLNIHGLGPGSIPKLHDALKAAGLTFKK